MVKIRLTRVGAKNDPKFRIVVAPARTKRDGKFLEILGYYHPREAKNNFKINLERYNSWLACGAQPTEAILKLVRIHNQKTSNGKS